jgi:hypothetical protein
MEHLMDMEFYSGPERRKFPTRAPDVTALVAGIFTTLGVTMLLLTFGGALGINVGSGAPDGALATQFGTWAFVSAVIGTLVGCFVGGLLSVRHGIASAIGHGLAACSGALAVGALLGTLGIVGLMGSALTFTGGSGDAISSIGWNGWALFVAVISSFVVAVGGWVAGLALQPRASHELRIEERHLVRPTERVRSGNGHGTRV